MPDTEFVTIQGSSGQTLRDGIPVPSNAWGTHQGPSTCSCLTINAPSQRETMKTESIARIAVALLAAAAGLAQAATNYVFNGDSIQTAINAAADGDTIVIAGGQYNESLSITKRLALQRLQGEEVFITGNVTLSGIVAPTNNPMIVSNLKIGGDTAKSLAINNCRHIWVNQVDLTQGYGLTANDSTLTLQNSVAPIVDLHRCDAAATRVNATSWFRHHTSGAAFNPDYVLTMLQCVVTNQNTTVDGCTARILYCDLYAVRSICGDLLAVGNHVRCRSTHPNTFYNNAFYSCGGKAEIRNNTVVSSGTMGYWYTTANNGVYIVNSEAHIHNNVFDLSAVVWDGYVDGDDINGINIEGDYGKTIEVSGNVFRGCYAPIRSHANRVAFRHNCSWQCSYAPNGGVLPEQCLTADPQFVDRLAGDFRLLPGSPCIDAGPPEAWFNDRDRTRNDIGCFGGGAYVPDGRTTDAPVPFGLSVLPRTVVKGVHDTVSVGGGGIVPGL